MSACVSFSPGIKGIPIMSLVPWEEKEGEHCRHPQQIMDTQRRCHMRDLTEEWLSVLAPSHTMWTVTVLWGHVTVMNCEMRHYSGGLSGLFCLLTIITVHNNELSYLLGPLWTIETKVILWDSLSMGCRARDEAAFNIIRWGIVSNCRVTNERNRRKYAVYIRFLLWVLVPHVFITIFMRSYVKSSP